MTGTRSASEVVNVLLGVSSIILMTLRDTSKISPVPYLSNAAGIALDIIMVVQNARQNRDGFKRLASDSCELVYVIARGHKDISRVENTG
ncbi:hypothetical protein F5887DRAFT_618836 [Amanita rubescens]|nr:hypothetical protein F5887DRAFT_618836 [Amanita rubescens]